MIEPIVKSVKVQAPIEIAFKVFSQDMSTWWDLDAHHIGSVPAVAAIVEPKAGGRWYERGQDGSECNWGKVLAYEPPVRLLLTWQISANWAFDPNLHTEVEVTFKALDAKNTEVQLVHRGLEAYLDAAPQMREMLEAGWPRTLETFAERGIARLAM